MSEESINTPVETTQPAPERAAASAENSRTAADGSGMSEVNTAPAAQPDIPAEGEDAPAETPAEAQSAPAETAQPAADGTTTPEAASAPAEPPKPAELSIEEKRRIAHEKAVAAVLRALRPNPPDPLEPFFAVCGRGSADEVRAAIAAGADVNLRNHNGITPLQRAVINNKLEAVQALVEAGADVTARSTGGMDNTVLHSAIWTKDPRVIQYLLDRGADPYALNADGWTPLRLGAYHMRDPELLAVLVQGMNPTAAAPGKRYKGSMEYVDSRNRRAYQLTENGLVVHNLRRVGRGIFPGHLCVIQYTASPKTRARVKNLTLKERAVREEQLRKERNEPRDPTKSY